MTTQTDAVNPNQPSTDIVPVGHPHPQETALVPANTSAHPVVAPQTYGGITFGLGGMTDHEFEEHLRRIKRGQVRAKLVKTTLMGPAHYGVIPGTKNPSLLKPGAELLLNVFGLVATYETTVTSCSTGEAPGVQVRSVCSIHIGDADGPIIASVEGESNSWERKNRRRQKARLCPECETPIVKGKQDFGGGFYCPRPDGGCGASWKTGKDLAFLATLPETIVENQDPWDSFNSILKIAAKRSLIPAVIAATNSGDLFVTEPAEAGPDPIIMARGARVQALFDVLKQQPDHVREEAKQRALNGGGTLTPKWLVENETVLAGYERWARNGFDGTTPPATATSAVEPEPATEHIQDAVLVNDEDDETPPVYADYDEEPF
jgi:hypothetical protein